MFQIDGLDRIKLTKGDSATFKCDIVTLLGEDYKLQTNDVLTLAIIEMDEDQTLLTLTADENGIFAITPEDTEDIDCGYYLYTINLDGVVGNYRIITRPFILTE